MVGSCHFFAWKIQIPSALQSSLGNLCMPVLPKGADLCCLCWAWNKWMCSSDEATELHSTTEETCTGARSWWDSSPGREWHWSNFCAEKYRYHEAGSSLNWKVSQTFSSMQGYFQEASLLKNCPPVFLQVMWRCQLSLCSLRCWERPPESAVFEIASSIIIKRKKWWGWFGFEKGMAVSEQLAPSGHMGRAEQVVPGCESVCFVELCVSGPLATTMGLL